MNTQEILDYIDSLEIEPRNPRLGPALADTDAPRVEGDSESAHVDDGSLVSFVSGLPALHKSDVLNSTLLAQLAANKKHDREKDTEQWYGFYREVLENVGWVVQAFEFERYHASGSTFTVDKAVLEILAGIATQNEVVVAESAMNALKALSKGDKPLMIWDSETHSAEAGNFQIATCVESGGNPVMHNGAFYFNTTEQTTGFLWFTYSSSDMSLYKAAQTMTLNEDVYSQVRDAVIKKLGDHATQYIADLDI